MKDAVKKAVEAAVLAERQRCYDLATQQVTSLPLPWLIAEGTTAKQNLYHGFVEHPVYPGYEVDGVLYLGDNRGYKLGKAIQSLKDTK